ncbi:MAG: MFS transporter [Gammaproteobacteria bacterium]|nr:MFS transporter [Gammaproteobacteria bacterium]
MTRRPEHLLILLGVAATLGFSVWQALLNNYAIEMAAFTGREIGILQSLREVPGFLAFTTVFVLLIIREQAFALVAVALLGMGVALTGFLPTEYGLYFTTVLMSTGFHYFYTVQQSLTLQWIEKERAPEVMGRLSAASSVAALLAFGTVWLGMSRFGFDYRLLYLLAGTAVVVLALFAAIAFPRFPQAVPQRKHLLMRRRYWLFYALTFMSGARRQIFIVFAGFLMVEKFGFSAANIALLFLINHVINTWAAPRIGRLIGRFGERPMLTLEYSGLILIFTAYAFVENASVAVLLYLLDHVLFAMAIAIRTYFQKIADPADMAATAGVSFTINHVAAVIIPVLFGLLWLHSPAAVFLSGTAMAAVSLTLSRWVPSSPCEGNEVRSFQPKAPAH